MPFFCLHSVVTLLKTEYSTLRTGYNHNDFIDELFFLPLNYWKALKQQNILLRDDHMVDLAVHVYIQNPWQHAVEISLLPLCWKSLVIFHINSMQAQ